MLACMHDHLIKVVFLFYNLRKGVLSPTVEWNLNTCVHDDTQTAEITTVDRCPVLFHTCYRDVCLKDESFNNKKLDRWKLLMVFWRASKGLIYMLVLQESA